MAEHARSGFAELDADEWLSRVSPSWRNPTRVLTPFRGWGTWLRQPLEIGETEWEGPRSTTPITDARGRVWNLVVTTEDEAPYRIAAVGLGVAPAPGVKVRAATADDADALEMLERRSPIELDGESKTIDRGGEVLDRYQMMGSPYVGIAFVDGEPAACNMSSVREAVIDGVERRLAYAGHVRVLPEYQGAGLFMTLNAWTAEQLSPNVDALYSIIDPANERMARLVVTEGTSGDVWRAVIPTRGASEGQLVGKPSTPVDGEELADLLNRAHGTDLLWEDYDPNALARRLERVPDRYGWARLRRTPRAAIGMWHGVERWSTGDEAPRTRGQILDYGVVEGGEDEFAALLEEARVLAGREGVDELSIFGSAGCCGEAEIRAAASHVEPYLFGLGGIEVSGAGRPVWIDQAYL